MIKAVFFDLDNTLYDYDSADKLATEALFNEFKKDKEISLEEFNRLYKQSKEEIKRELIGMASSHNRILYLQRLTEKVHGTVTPKRILELYHAYWDTLVENASPFDGAMEVLKEIQSRGIKIALVTNLTTYVQLRKINHLGISDYVDYLVTSEEAGYDKPHPASFLLALHKAKVLASDVVMIGDSLDNDIEGAKSLGMQAILYNFGKQSEKPIFEPDYTVENQGELLALIKVLIGDR